ncbi:MAG: glycosyltransferase family 4 protein [Leptolyngbyaceae cyanobacterium SM1_1_3]|nr:glycosyltransferase family 4 protein [Leptolyngbyaceae cyanobacterium SM1_1_3]NJN02127.1 glycosyltransferase family 4 protein [Leptolyngbyaceae cyanobacterium RM1_1_2]NJO11125.1 glycosyltransferase family 4 protein [Leptolyngbyaceae cyanobacterium SL_1_1]
MRIAQIAPLWEQVPPPAYGGIELILGLLTDELIRRGHEVTLFASGDSDTLAQLEPGCEKALRPQGLLPPEYAVYEQMQLSRAFGQSNKFDLIHSHMDYTALPYANFSKTPVVHTLHGPFTPTTEQIFTQHRQQNFVSISNSQRRLDLGLNYVATVYNAIATDSIRFYAQPDEQPYLAFLGRMSVEKGPHLAIEIAKRSGWRLKMAGKLDFENTKFFEREVAPHIDGKQIEFLGEASHSVKNDLIGKATATLFPITWPEPFGLVMTESMASGTPVIAMALGSAPEVIADRKTGFLCNSLEDCLKAVTEAHKIDRCACRKHVESNFRVRHMVDGYEAVYHQLLKDRVTQNGFMHKSTLIAV